MVLAVGTESSAALHIGTVSDTPNRGRHDTASVAGTSSTNCQLAQRSRHASHDSRGMSSMLVGPSYASLEAIAATCGENTDI